MCNRFGWRRAATNNSRISKLSGNERGSTPPMALIRARNDQVRAPAVANREVSRTSLALSPSVYEWASSSAMITARGTRRDWRETGQARDRDTQLNHALLHLGATYGYFNMYIYSSMIRILGNLPFLPVS